MNFIIDVSLPSNRLPAVRVIVCCALVAAATAAGQTNFTVLKSFSGDPGLIVDGAVPFGRVLCASDGWLYGTTVAGGTNSFTNGVVYKMLTNGSGFEVVKSFSSTDGATPVAEVIEASDGFLYGTTYAGGISNAGTVYKVSRDGTDSSVLHHFLGGGDGANPQGTVIEGSDGYLYGMADFGVTTARGTVFKVSKSGSHYAILHTFTGSPDGQQPSARLLKGSDGALYGTTSYGGWYNRGAVFRINEDGTGYWICHDFASGDGSVPTAGLIEGSDHLFYGVANYFGPGGGGTVFKLDNYGLTFTVIHTFTNSGTGLYYPASELVEGADGSLYGATGNGGKSNNGGIYRLNRDGSGYTVLRDFDGTSGWGDGRSPKMALCRIGDDLFYGTTRWGGLWGAGTIFILSTYPVPPRALTISVSDNSSIVEFAGTAAVRYDVESSATLCTWSNLATMTAPAHGAISVTNNSPPQPAVFYRVRLH